MGKIGLIPHNFENLIGKRFNTKEKAINHRKELEAIYFKEYSPTLTPEELERMKGEWGK
jgi:hypothetical protein